MDNKENYSNSPLHKSRLTEQIAERIQEIITQNRLEPGTRLPSDGKLAELFHVSQATVSEAIRLVEERGLVQRITGSGTYVTDQARSAFIESMKRLFIHSNCSREDVLTYRNIFEPNITALAAECASPEDLANIKEIIEQVELAYEQGNFTQQAEADINFQEALAKSTHNELLIAVSIGAFKVLLSTNVDIVYTGNPVGIRSYWLIYEAIAAHDPERARVAMEYHLTFARLKENNHDQT